MKKYKVYITDYAEKDIKEIYDYIFYNDSESNADRIINLIYNKCNTLSLFPGRGRIVPELYDLGLYSYRQIEIKVYRIIYHAEEKNVFIDFVLDERRNLKDLLIERISKFE